MRTTCPAGLVELLGAAGAVEEFVDQKLAAIGLSIPKLAALSRLADAGESLPLGQLADRLACVKSNVTQLVDRLEADGLVRREPDPNDRRSRLAVLTAEGRIAHARGMAAQLDAEQEVFGRLSPEEALRLMEIVRKLSTRHA